MRPSFDAFVCPILLTFWVWFVVVLVVDSTFGFAAGLGAVAVLVLAVEAALTVMSPVCNQPKFVLDLLSVIR